MLVIVVTGGIGSGKTTATERFRSKGAAVLDLDLIAHALLDPGQASYDELVDAFGPDVLAADGTIDRAALAKAAFASAESCALLNHIMHPAVAREAISRISALRAQADPPAVAVMEVPLLVEAPSFAEVADVVLALSAERELRLERCVSFGRAPEDAIARMSCQATDAERELLADRTIVNDGSPHEFEAELDAFWDEVVNSRGAT